MSTKYTVQITFTDANGAIAVGIRSNPDVMKLSEAEFLAATDSSPALKIAIETHIAVMKALGKPAAIFQCSMQEMHQQVDEVVKQAKNKQNKGGDPSLN